MMHKTRVLWGVMMLLTHLAMAQYPSWWTNRGVADPTSASTNDYALANQGQVKWFATNAYAELEYFLPGGAGSGIVATLQSFTLTNNYCSVTLGQLKNTARPFYDRLMDEGYTNAYPWTTATTDDQNYAVANIGQVKNLFAFDLRKDTDADALPDWWERRWFGSIASYNSTNDPDGDSLSNIIEYQHGTCPTDTDTDSDGLGDYQEINTTHSDPRDADTDNDGLLDGQEVLTYGTNPNLADTDGDGYIDYDEVINRRTDPNNSDTIPPFVQIIWPQQGSSQVWVP